MQFQVPQFITMEDKLIGPLSLKQFLILAGAAGICALLYPVFNLYLWLTASSFIMGGTAAFSLIKINGQPLPKILFAAFLYIWNPTKYVWKKEIPKTMQPQTQNKIKELAMKLFSRK